MDPRAGLDVDTLLKIVLVLVIAWLVVEVVSETVAFLLGPLQPLLGIVIVVLIVLYLLDKI